MTISYNWLSEYLPERIDPAKLSGVLTSIGLEVESMEAQEEIRGGLEGLIAGEVITCDKHPDADKLKLTTVSVNGERLLNIVCGATNVAAGQKVIIAPVGATIHPVKGDPVKLKKAKIRGAESEGMICAEDEIGLGTSHDGIYILPPDTVPGTPIASIFKPKTDFIYEIGLTPNRMDAMSHLGVAKDVCAWLSYHNKKETQVQYPYPAGFNSTASNNPVSVSIENSDACRRYSGISISDITVTDSPEWLKQKLQSIGLNPINNIVDITNFILHETGQPLHAFDADKIKGNKIIVKNLPEGTTFITLDEKERKLSAEDLMICNAEEGMCIAGVYGGANSGVTATTKNIFLESAWFNPGSIRKTSLKHGLRTDAASRFEKGVDISNTVKVLQRTALLITEIAGGQTQGDLIDVYPAPLQKTRVVLPKDYLKKLSGKNYPSGDIEFILKQLGFDIISNNEIQTVVDVPFSKPDISLPADIVEEIMRIDGLDNVDIPSLISITPSVEKNYSRFLRREKLSDYLTGLGFFEIFTNSITNSHLYTEEVLTHSVKMINSLSAELDMLRPEMLQGGLQVIAHNLNRKNTDLRLFEFGKTYTVSAEKRYTEAMHLAIYIAGNTVEQNWKSKPVKADFFYLKGVIEKILMLTGIKLYTIEPAQKENCKNAALIKSGNKTIGYFGELNDKTLRKSDVKAQVFFADIHWDDLLAAKTREIEYREISKFPAVMRDLALVVDKNVSYSQIEGIALSGKIAELRSVQLFDVFESDKLGQGKKSMAVSFMFQDETRTLTDKEIDSFMQKLVSAYESSVGAEIRK
ncbi:MAG: phenylalanine--tRNA ligase subunit beta [Bacteroidetes bacterium]|nr:phenylalanine--tRNA ligase subunit beta [Bacteroidota bacterium]